jgi:hypothetical protein
MLEELLGKTVTIHLGVMGGITDSVKGEVLEVKGSWMKLRAKKTTELISVEKIRRVSLKL